MDRNILPADQIVTNSNEIQNSILNIFKNHEEFLWKKHRSKPSIKLPELT